MTCAPRLLPHRPPMRPNKLYQQAQEVLLNDLPAVPLYYANAYGVAATGVSGFEMNWQNLPVYENMTKSGK